MTDQTASAPTPVVIDLVEFTRLGRALAGEIGVRQLPRLQDLVVAGDERLHYELHGTLSPRREPQITCIIHGLVSLECQRCLEPFEHGVASRSTLVFVADESRLPAMGEEDESIDYLVAQKTLDVLALVEDEVILALPLVPRHEAGECKASAGQQSAGDEASPFAALAKLKRE